MSLNWNISEVEDWEAKKKANPDLLEKLIFSTMLVGIPKITKKNYMIFYARHIAHDMLFKTSAKYQIKLEDIKKWIGLSTNADKLSGSQWEKKLLEIYKPYNKD